MMKIDRSLQEVWDWKEKGYREGMSHDEWIKDIHEKAAEMKKKYNLKLRTYSKSASAR